MLSWSGEDVVQSFNLGFSYLSGSLVEIDSGGLHKDVGESSAYSLDGSQSELGFDSSFHVGILHSENMLEVIIIDNSDL